MPESPKSETILHPRIGENIYALVDGGKITEMRIVIQNLSQIRIGQQYCARVNAIDLRLSAAFIDLGGAQALLSFKGKRPAYLVEGKAILVEITRAGFADKIANAAYIGDAKTNIPCPSLFHDIPEWGYWHTPTPATPEQAEIIENYLEAATHKIFPLAGGGNIAIETTRALTAIDIDAGARQAHGTNQLNFNHKLNKEAAFEIARLIRLYNISGLIVVDFVGAPFGESARELAEILQNGLKGGVKCEILPLSKLGLCEISRARKGLSLSDICASPEHIAINALNALANALNSAKGRVITLEINRTAYDFLQIWGFDWQKHLEQRIGGRFNIIPANIDEYEII